MDWVLWLQKIQRNLFTELLVGMAEQLEQEVFPVNDRTLRYEKLRERTKREDSAGIPIPWFKRTLEEQMATFEPVTYIWGSLGQQILIEWSQGNFDDLIAKANLPPYLCIDLAFWFAENMAKRYGTGQKVQ